MNNRFTRTLPIANDADAQAEMLASDFDFNERAIPLQHQGQVFTNSKQLAIGQTVVDTFLGWNRICEVVKRYRISVLLSYVDGAGKRSEYVQSLRHLRRAT
jgi:hypothetical protein